MNKNIQIRYYLLLSILLLLGLSLKSQDLINSRRTSFYTYIYKLTDKEAKQIYQKDIWVVDSTFFHNLVDSFPTDSEYTRKLKPGHYIKTFSQENKQNISVTTVSDFDVNILDNNTDLIIKIVDLQGNIIPDADVKIDKKTIRFDKKTQSYFKKKSNKNGFLIVVHQGFTAYYKLDRKYNNSLFKRTISIPIRGVRFILYRRPVRYVWLPVRFVLRTTKTIVLFPIKKTISVLHGYPLIDFDNVYYSILDIPENVVELYKNTKKNIVNFGYKQKKYFNGDYSVQRFNENHTGYIVFNKPMYKPGDTVKFKAYIIKNGKPIKKKLNVEFAGSIGKIKLAELTPFRKGAYEYEFELHDSLDLKLDRNYLVSLEKDKRKIYISQNIRYEDYELSKINLSIRQDSETQYKGKEYNIYIKGTDVNELNLIDARLEITALRTSVSKLYDKHVFVPDEIFFIKEKIKHQGETKILIPDTIFPKADFEYQIKVKLLTADNQTITEQKQVKYFHLREEFNIELIKDSLRFTYKENDEIQNTIGEISATDKFGNKTTIYMGEIPYSLKINQFYSEYIIKKGDLSQTFTTANMSPGLQCFSERIGNRIKINVENPNKLYFNYFIYKKNKLITKGYTDSLSLDLKAISKQNYFVMIQFMWGGTIQKLNTKIEYKRKPNRKNKALNISVKQPKIIYPGQKIKIDLLVTNAKGKPVSGVDITAYSLTKKFNYTAPGIPDFSKAQKWKKGKKIINSFSIINQQNTKNNNIRLDYPTWKILSGIDSIEYYKFLYPGDKPYRLEYTSPDSVTQFAPFVVSDGALQAVHVIYVDYKPVYFSWSTHTQPYSFKIDSGYHHIRLRTANKIIDMDSVYFNAKEKLILCVRDSSKNKYINFQEVSPVLDNYERTVLSNYIFAYRNNFKGRFAYIENGDKIQLLKPSVDNTYYNFAGPVVGEVTFNSADSFTVNFINQPFYDYEFIRGKDKPKVNPTNFTFLFELNKYSRNSSFSDQYITKEILMKMQKEYIESLKLKERDEFYYSEGYGWGAMKTGSLKISYLQTGKQYESPLNVLIFKYNSPDFVRIYRGNTVDFYALKKGLYKLILVYKDERYQIIDSVDIRSFGINFHEIDQTNINEKDSYSSKINKIIESFIVENLEDESVLKDIYFIDYRHFSCSNPDTTIVGHVFEKTTGIPAQGVKVGIYELSGIETVTDINGYYSIKVPASYCILTFSFRNETKNCILGLDMLSKVILDVPNTNISQINIVEYKRNRSQAITGSYSTMDSEKIEDIPVANFDSLLDYTGYADFSISEPSNNLESNKIGKITSNKKISENLKNANYDSTFISDALNSNSIRNNFSDYAFWQPRIITDKKGKASFEVTFPDDVTSWETYFAAMNGKKQSGQTKKIINSYKPLMAELKVPRFLVESDSISAIGKCSNYTSDTIAITSKFELNKKEIFSKSQNCISSVVDSLSIVATSDTMELKYLLETKDGYLDGELRTIPVFPLGLEKTIGNFHVLDNDTSILISPDSTLGKLTIYAKSDVRNVIEDEIKFLKDYHYECNEQLASKLKALLALQKLKINENEEFENKEDITKYINLLIQNQNIERLWGWWGNSKTDFRFSIHVLEALKQAKDMNYPMKFKMSKTGTDTVRLNKDFATALVWYLESEGSFTSKVDILKIAKFNNSYIKYTKYIADLDTVVLKHIAFNKAQILMKKRPLQRDTITNLNYFNILQLIELKQTLGFNYKIDSVISHIDTTLFGNLYIKDDFKTNDSKEDNIRNTLIAYKILTNDTVNHDVILTKMRNYFLEEKKSGHWQNTYESSRIIETILPDLLRDSTKFKELSLKIEGDTNITVIKFPFSMEINSNQNIKISKEGSFPLYLSNYQQFWNPKPEIKKNDFEIETYFENDSTGILKAGEKVKLIAKVTVKKEAQEYIMINIPIPGACSYDSKIQKTGYEIHREYFKNETAIFCEKLPKGTHYFEIDLMPRYTGTYTLNPAKVELMYFPVFNANTAVKKVEVK